MTRLTTVTRYPNGSMTRCGEIDPKRPKLFCTIEDPAHHGDHYHEYSGSSWPREQLP